MALPQGLNGSKHAPPSNTNNTSTSSKLNPATAPTFRPGFRPDTTQFSFIPPPVVSPSPPPKSPDRIQERKTSSTVKPPTPPAKKEHSLPSAKSLRLEGAMLVGTSSTLPNFSIDAVLMQRTGEGDVFSVYVLAAGVIQDCSVRALNNYLDSFSRERVQTGIRELVSGRHPVLFYAAERNSVDCVRLLLDYGCDPNACDVDGVPVLAYTIMRSKTTILNPTDVVKMLLAFGADPRVIPSDMWETYLETPTALPRRGYVPEPKAQWCTPYHRGMLAATLNLSVRYFLHKASQISVTKGRAMQIAQEHNYAALLKVRYLIIGQDHATKQVVHNVSTHLGMQRKRPLVLVFAGLSGHGKTELAKQLGGLLQLPTTVIDCAQMRSDIGLFGSRMGYIDNANGSQLNNHLADNSGQRSLVFLDQFDKTEKQIHNSLLLVLGNGQYHDRRTNRPVDCSKTIWIMASNSGDQEITKFYRTHLDGVDPKEKTNVPYTRLTEQLKARFRSVFGAPMAGRMRSIAPFFPFDRNERAVVAHKFLMELVEEVREPIDTTFPAR